MQPHLIKGCLDNSQSVNKNKETDVKRKKNDQSATFKVEVNQFKIDKMQCKKLKTRV